MHPRYPAPIANVVFDPQAVYQRWTYVSALYAKEAIRKDNPENKDRLLDALHDALPPTPAKVEEHDIFGHDVVAFLSAFTEQMPPILKPYVHRGLTSSDLVDNGHFLALRTHADGLSRVISDVMRQLEQYQLIITTRAGRTHGQVADLTSLGHQFHVHYEVLSDIRYELVRYSTTLIWKSAGPTGHSPLVRIDALTVGASIEANVVASTQVIPRDYQLRWASLYLRLACELESLATLIRCGARQEIGEFREGVSRVGSSAMPTKKNPIDSEKVCGLARVARGYFMSLAENVALWDDRDISNSSVERIVVPDFASVVEYMTRTMQGVLMNLEVDYQRMRVNSESMHTMTNLLQSLAQKHFQIGPVEAGRMMRQVLYPDSNTIDGWKLRKAGFTEAQIYAWKNEAESIWNDCRGERNGLIHPWTVLSSDPDETDNEG